MNGPRIQQEKPPFPPETRRWRGRDIAYFGVVFLLLSVAVGDLVQFLPFRGESAEAFQALAVTLVVELILVGSIAFLVRFVYKRPFWAEMGWSQNYTVGNGQLLLLGMGLAFTVMAVSTVFPPSAPPIERLLETPQAIIVFAVFGITFAPLLEELMFRGFLFRVLDDMASGRIAVIATALLFALLHVPQLWGSWPGIGVILGVGWLLSELRHRTGSLIPPLIVHTAYNSMLFLAFAVSMLAGSEG